MTTSARTSFGRSPGSAYTTAGVDTADGDARSIRLPAKPCLRAETPANLNGGTGADTAEHADEAAYGRTASDREKPGRLARELRVHRLADKAAHARPARADVRAAASRRHRAGRFFSAWATD